ncbi:hypothetical protein ACFXOL_17365 [Streptomyces californicus]|uniref:hypothetical protein n=1 Tax=Streptomyces TaxID=1883 RepID=UPI00211B2057|nr:hypothetical protein [Streptomyces sp. CB04723]
MIVALAATAAAPAAVAWQQVDFKRDTYPDLVFTRQPTGMDSDLDGDGYDEVVVGLPGEDVGEAKDAGGVLVFKGRASDITGAGVRVIGQSAASAPGVDEKGDAFVGEAHVVAAAKGVPATLVVGAPGENTNQRGVSFSESSLGIEPSAVRIGNWLG